MDIDTPIIDVDLDTVLDPIEEIVGDIDIDIDAIVDNLLPGDHGLLPDINATINAVIGGTNVLGVDLSEILAPVSPVITQVTNLVDGVIDGVEGVLPEELVQPITHVINTVLDLTGLAGGDGDTDLQLNLGAIIPGFNTLDIGIDIPLNPLEVLLGDIDITVDATAIVEDLGAQLFAVIEDVGEGDIAGVIDTVIGDGGILQDVGGIIPELLVGLDVATDILPDFAGDIGTDDLLGDVINTAGDLLDGTSDILPLDDLLDDNPLGSDVVGGVLDGLLGLGDSAPAPDGDTDLVLNTDVDVLGLEIPDINLDVPLDIVESVIGDIDIDVDVASLTSPDTVTDLAGGIAEGDLSGAIEDLGTSVGLDADLALLGGDVLDVVVPDMDGLADIPLLGDVLNGGSAPGNGDTDLSLGGGTEIPLDIVESLIGDVDINIDLAALAEPESVSSILDDLSTGDIEGVIDDLGTALNPDAALDLLGGDILEGGIADLGGGADVLGGITDTTSSVVEGLGSAVEGLLGQSTGPVALPDPVGTLTGGLGGVVDTTPVLGGLGGLFGGGGGGGGLFG